MRGSNPSRVLRYAADDWGSDEELGADSYPDSPSPREKNMEELNGIHNKTLLIFAFACGFVLRGYLN